MPVAPHRAAAPALFPMPPRPRVRTSRDVDGDDGATDANAEETRTSMSVDETNALRATLGLAPLRARTSRAVVDARTTSRTRASTTARASRTTLATAGCEGRTRVAAAGATATLGDAEANGGDDVGDWLAKTTATMANAARASAAARAARVGTMLDARDAEAEASASASDASAEATKRGAEATYTSKDLRGIKVRHAAEEIAEGRETVLTLRDASVLDEDAEDELENVLMAERASRKKARREATKRATDDQFAEADARDKTVLGKYDAKEDAEAMELDGEGGIDAAEEKRKAEIKARLVAELSGIRGKLDTAEMVKGQQADFHTQEEMQAKFVKSEKKKKMRKKLRTKHIDAAELENDVMAPETRDHGSRRARGERAAAEEEKLTEKDAKFVNALQKAREVTYKKILAEMAGEIEEDEDDELARALARSRKMAAAKPARAAPDDIAAQVAARRLADEARARETAEAPAEYLVFTDMSEFVQGITNANDDDDDDLIEAEMPDVPPPPPGEEEMPDVPPPPPADGEDEMPDVPPPPPDVQTEPTTDVVPVLAEKHVVKQGLASTLALLKEKAQLDDTQNTRWSGRANDLKDHHDKKHVLEALAVDDATTSDGYKFGFRLDKFDEFGRKLTPKEAFRELCHRFHGIEPGRMKREKRLQQYQEEQKRLQQSSVMDERIKTTQREQATPYVVLSGQVRAAQTKQADPMATKRREQASSASPAPPTRLATHAGGVKPTNAGKVSFAMKPSKK